MPGFLRIDSPFYRAWTGAADLVIINALTLIGCLPVVTAGAALTACARITMDMVRDEDGYIVRTWWRIFRGELIRSLAWWLPTVGVLALAVWENRTVAAGAESGAIGANPAGLGALSGLLLAGGAIVVGVLVWLVRTATCLVVTSAPAILACAVPQSRAAVTWFMVLLGLAFQGYLMALIQRSVIDRLRRASG